MLCDFGSVSLGAVCTKIELGCIKVAGVCAWLFRSRLSVVVLSIEGSTVGLPVFKSQLFSPSVSHAIAFGPEAV